MTRHPSKRGQALASRTALARRSALVLNRLAGALLIRSAALLAEVRRA